MLLKSLVGVVRLSSGTVKVGDRDLTNSAPEEVARAAVGYVPQVDDVFSPLTVRENLEMGGYLLRRAQVAERVERVLAIFPRLGGMLGRSAGKLSGGERKMLAMGRVLMLDPGLFLLDEPTANLAPIVATALLTEHVRQLADSGAAVLIVEQRAKAVLAISDRSYVLGGGEVRMAGQRPLSCPPARISSSPSSGLGVRSGDMAGQGGTATGGDPAAAVPPPIPARYLQVQTTTDSRAEAVELGRGAVEARLAACAQVAGPVVSSYWWEGDLERAEEWLLLPQAPGRALPGPRGPS